MADLSAFLDFMEDVEGDGGFDSPLMPSVAHPEGRQYRVPSPDAKTGLRLSALADLTVKQEKGHPVAEHDLKRLRLDDNDEREFIAQCLSPGTVEEMVADGVKYEHMKRMAIFAFTWFGISREAAEEAARNGLLSGKALAAPNRQARRAAAKKPTPSASSASKRTTRPAAKE